MAVACRRLRSSALQDGGEKSRRTKTERSESVVMIEKVRAGGEGRVRGGGSERKADTVENYRPVYRRVERRWWATRRRWSRAARVKLCDGDGCQGGWRGWRDAAPLSIGHTIVVAQFTLNALVDKFAVAWPEYIIWLRRGCVRIAEHSTNFPRNLFIRLPESKWRKKGAGGMLQPYKSHHPY